MLAIVLAIAATASYIHLREVWEYARAPIAPVGPIIVDGLFASAWLRMRRRRLEGMPVGWLAWAALLAALGGTVAGNLYAAWISGARDAASLTVAVSPAIAFALVFELATGHAAKPRQAAATLATPPGEGGGTPDKPDETWEQKRDRLLVAGATQRQLCAELGLTRWQVRQLLAERASDGEELA